MKKYISYFAYLGNRFNGVQRQLPRNINPLEAHDKGLDPYRVNTVQQMLDDALMSIYPRPLSIYTGKVKNDGDSIECEQLPVNTEPITNQSIVKESSTNALVDSQSNESADSKDRKLLLRTGLSSRTDKGVHAIENVYTFELQHPHGLTYKPVELTRMLNLYLLRRECDILVRRTVIVQDEFNVFLAAKSRRYVYRLALLKPNVFKGKHTILRSSEPTFKLAGEQSFEVSAYNGKGEFDLFGGAARPIFEPNPTEADPESGESGTLNRKQRIKNYLSHDMHLDSYADQYLPISELYRCLAIDSTYASIDADLNEYDWRSISLQRMRAACEKFVGKHDFDSFRAPYKGKSGKKELNTIRNITRFELLPAEPSWAQYELDSQYDLFDWYHFVIEADSFLYRQVRRMIGTIISVGRAELPLDQIDYLLQNPNYHNWKAHYYMAPAHGLYLQQVKLDNGWFTKEEREVSNTSRDHESIEQSEEELVFN
jgi:tRNA pseudouridine(38-40) synthase